MMPFPDISITAFVVTLALGAVGAWLTGRAFARVWRPWWVAALWVVPLAGAVRFFQVALFRGTWAAGEAAAVVLVVLVLAAAAGHRRTRAVQMVSRYGWLYRPAGLLGWRFRPGGEG